MRYENSPLNRLSSPHRAYSSSLTDFMPFRLTSIARDIENDVREPRIGSRSVPMLDAGRDDENHAWV